jgi:hypothetical protein
LAWCTATQVSPKQLDNSFDLPPVRPIFEEFVAHHGLSDRLRFQAGDFFADTLPNADVIITGHILHDWDVSQQKMLLSNAFTAVPNGGAVIVYDAGKFLGWLMPRCHLDVPLGKKVQWS